MYLFLLRFVQKKTYYFVLVSLILVSLHQNRSKKNVQTLLHHLSCILTEIYPYEEAVSITRLWLSEEIGWSTLLLYTGKDTDLSEEERKKTDLFLERLLRGEPVQYVMGRAFFLDHWFLVTPGVLIPRPETGELVKEVLRDWSPRSAVSLLDIGTGSGCISIMLSLKMSDAYVEAWDISSEALRIAAENAQRLGAKVILKEVDLFKRMTALEVQAERYDVIVSNPPYVLDSEKAEMEPHVLDWEPPTALFVPDSEPLLYYRSICQLAKLILKPGGMLYFEINARLGSQMQELMKEMGYQEIQLKKDMFGRERIIKGKR